MCVFYNLYLHSIRLQDFGLGLTLMKILNDSYKNTPETCISLILLEVLYLFFIFYIFLEVLYCNFGYL